jgi:hypothetical protein
MSSILTVLYYKIINAVMSAEKFKVDPVLHWTPNHENVQQEYRYSFMRC